MLISLAKQKDWNWGKQFNLSTNVMFWFYGELHAVIMSCWSADCHSDFPESYCDVVFPGNQRRLLLNTQQQHLVSETLALIYQTNPQQKTERTLISTQRSVFINLNVSRSYDQISCQVSPCVRTFNGQCGCACSRVKPGWVGELLYIRYTLYIWLVSKHMQSHSSHSYSSHKNM